MKKIVTKLSTIVFAVIFSNSSFAQYYDLQVNNDWMWSLGKVKMQWFCDGVFKDTDEIKYGKKKTRGLAQHKCTDVNKLSVKFYWAGGRAIAVNDFGKALSGRIAYTELDGNGDRNVCMKIETGYNILANKGC